MREVVVALTMALAAIHVTMIRVIENWLIHQSGRQFLHVHVGTRWILESKLAMAGITGFVGLAVLLKDRRVRESLLRYSKGGKRTDSRKNQYTDISTPIVLHANSPMTRHKVLRNFSQVSCHAAIADHGRGHRTGRALNNRPLPFHSFSELSRIIRYR
jgi:hypothetical protein